MFFEKRWPAVPLQLLSADGTSQGLVTVPTTLGLYFTKQVVTLASNTQPSVRLQIGQVLSATTMILAPLATSDVNAWADVSAYLVADGASIVADEQPRYKIGPEYILRSVYAEEPVGGIRTYAVDRLGNPYSSSNPLPVIFQESGGTPDYRSVYNEISSVPSGSPSTIATYTVPALKTAMLQRVSASGENLGRFDVTVNGSNVDTRRTYFGGDFNVDFDFTTPLTSVGFSLNSGDVVTVVVIPQGVDLAVFDARIQVVELG